MTDLVLITGGAGFIGANLADRLLGLGREVVVFDNLSRPGSRLNLAWLQARHGAGNRLRFVQGDIRNSTALEAAARGTTLIVHLAGQVAVTTSIADPRGDFEANALGTLNALEAARRAESDPVFLYASTNKVYGPLSDLELREDPTRYSLPAMPHGISEGQPLDFHSPYGCSKGTGDQYVRDYFRIYGLRTVVLRQSCVFGQHQPGIEDQGWVAWFVIAAVGRRPLTIYGDGKQVRDLLYVDDLLDAYEAAEAGIGRAAGQVYNVGGGPDRSVSVWCEFGALLGRLLGAEPPVARGPWRSGDQRFYVSDIRRAARDLAWRPRVDVETGVRRVIDWVRENRRALP